MSTGEEILNAALARAREREAAYTPVDYHALNKMIKRQRAALTRAINSKDPVKVVKACKAAVDEWNRPGMAWPDDWSRWQRALHDALPMNQWVRLEDL